VPISIDEFESGDLPSETSVPERVVSFLASNPDRAYTRSEIARSVEVDPDTVSTALSRLSDRDLVRHRGRYWAVIDDTERVRAAYDLHRATSALDADDGGIDPEEWDEHVPDEPHPSERDARSKTDDGSERNTEG
jgi:Mn-dependent DtxR family transcriptional regulator